MKLSNLGTKLQSFDKESLSDILHFTATGIKAIFQCDSVRFYLEDLYEGMLICHYVTGQNQPDKHRITKYISSKESISSQAFYDNEVTVSWDIEGGLSNFRNPYESIAGIKSTAVFPIMFQMRPIGTLNLDWNKEGRNLTSSQIDSIVSFLTTISPIIQRAKSYHQKISFSKHLDNARKKDGAWLMMRSAVNLIEKLELASVLIPSIKIPQTLKEMVPSDLVEILAVYTKNIDHVGIYDNKEQISVLKGDHLINKIVHYDKNKGLLMNNAFQETIYHKNIMNEKFSRKSIVSKINLVSLYQVPKYDPDSGQFICAVNYYTSEPYEFTPFEKGLLQEHASMVENLILEKSSTHIEIQVLSEIEGLLSESDSSLQTFLHNILAKTSELLGADCGTISLLQFIDDTPWLVVESDEGKLIGAKSRGWKKNKIPPLRVGGNDLHHDLRSLNGYCAHTARPVLFEDVQNPEITQGFYKNLSQSIRSELAVPIIFDNRVLGVINQDSFQVNYFNEEHKKILQIISTLISQRVHHLLQIDEVKREMAVVRKDIEYRDPNVSSYYLGNVIGKSRKIHNLVKQIDTVAESICNRMLNWDRGKQWEALMGLPCLLITGSTGTGKEFFFNNIYSRISEIFSSIKGPGFQLPLRKTNIAAYSGELTYSELFGHKKGAFTGAESNRQGILEEADGGIVFLDEIGDADPKTQVQLLRFLDTGAFMRLGESQPRYSRIFLVAATNKNLSKEIEEGRFREDLFHRMNALTFYIPSLNQRREDIEDLATHFLGRLSQTYKNDSLNNTLYTLDPKAIDLLKSYQYRGNVRELKNILLRSVMFSKGPLIKREDIIEANKDNWSEPSLISQETSQFEKNVLETLENSGGTFWSHVYEPFKDKQITRDNVKSFIEMARNKYQANLPGLALKLGVCGNEFRKNPKEYKKFISFKNFLYKTIKISED